MCELLIMASELLHISMNKDPLETATWSLSLESIQLNDIFLEKTVTVFYRNNFTKIFWDIFEGIPIKKPQEARTHC